MNPDVYKVRDDAIVSKSIAIKKLVLEPAPQGGVSEQVLDAERQNQPALSDEQILRLARIGRRIEKHFGRPQDIEWCVAGHAFHIVQSYAAGANAYVRKPVEFAEFSDAVKAFGQFWLVVNECAAARRA